MNYRLYLDESGDHSSSDPEEIGKRYLGLIGVVFRRDHYDEFRTQLEDLKRRHLSYDVDDPPILHREDIVYKRGAFWVLSEETKRRAFDEDLTSVIRSSRFRLIAVVIDKVEHGKKKYRRLKHPYHYCMQAILERYCGWLRFSNNRGDVMAESRGAKEDRALKEAYEAVCNRGTYYLPKDIAQKTLTSKHAKIKSKALNVGGLQLADLLAHPITRDVLAAYRRIPDRGSDFADRVSQIVESKYNCHEYDGRINGYGRIILA